jgi:uncharacterized protein (DUF1330 family)
MTRTSRLTSAILAAAALGAVAVPSLRAQGTPPTPAYVINEIEVTDPAIFADYAARQGDLVARFGGRFLIRGGEPDTVAGASVRQRVTVYVFDSLAQARAWRAAPEQSALAALRDKASKFRSFIVEGCTSCKPPAG